MRWQLAFPEDTPLLRFDDEALVFNPSSWETHFLNEAAAFVVESLHERAQSVEELVAVASRAAEAPLPEAFAEQVAELLQQLAALGLVRAVG